MKQIECVLNKKHMITWTDQDEKLKCGNFIRFKDENEYWKIENVYSPSLEKSEIKRNWHVGAL
jgi:hypothetical protein